MNNLFTLNLSHWKGGNNYACVEILPNEYCRVGRLGKNKDGVDVIDGDQFFLACTRPTVLNQWSIQKYGKDLTPIGEPEVQMLTPSQLEMLQPIRDGLASGKLKVVNTRIVEVT